MENGRRRSKNERRCPKASLHSNLLRDLSATSGLDHMLATHMQAPNQQARILFTHRMRQDSHGKQLTHTQTADLRL